MLHWLMKQVNAWVLLAALVVVGGLVALLVLLVYYMPQPAKAEVNPVLTIIPAPTITPTSAAPTATPTLTPPVEVDGISVGRYVQISGTEGAGLRLREGPGTNKAMRFVGMDAEVFLVKDGPQEGDGFTWWYLEAPYDPSRSGWAASKYLTVINQPTNP